MKRVVERLLKGGLLVTAGLGLLVASTGCAARDQLVVQKFCQGDYGQAGGLLVGTLEKNPAHRTYLYDRMELAMLHLADGRPEVATQTVDEVFDKLRTQGINQDRTVACFITTEKGAKFWKGEPFEQAMMFVYAALQKAMVGEWDNARSASVNSLFMLTDFGLNEQGTRKSGPEIVKAAAQREKQARAQKETISDGVSASYAPAETDFALGYLIAGVSNAVLGMGDPDRAREAEEQYQHALEVNPALEPVVTALAPGSYNTVLVVDYGLGPTKYRYGMDGVYSAFAQQRGWYSGDEPLHVTVTGVPSAGGEFPPACDLNAMAADHRWNNLEQLRVAKSYIGTGLLIGGAVASYFNSYAGYGLSAAGALMKATAQADITYCPIMPQRVYVAPLLVAAPGTTIELQVGDDSNSRMVLVAIDPPKPPQRVQLRYVRLVPARRPLDWATAGQVLYDNDFAECPTDPAPLPYILGGRCVCRPTHELLARYQQAGNLQDLTLAQLEDLYRAEGIDLDSAGSGAARAGAHILEGGSSLDCPLPGTAGYARLFGREHPAYRPKSMEVSELAARLRGQTQSVVASRQ